MNTTWAYTGDLEAAKTAYDEHVRAHSQGCSNPCTDPKCTDPDCGEFSRAWYAGDLSDACRAHAEHAAHDAADHDVARHGAPVTAIAA